MKIQKDECGAQHIRLTRVEKDHLKAIPAHTGQRREALKQLIANAYPTPMEAAEGLIGFYDATMSAGHFFSWGDLDAQRAAMLLCQFNPNGEGLGQPEPFIETLERARRSTNDAIRPNDFVLLMQRFEDIAKCEPKHRSLRQWLQIARALKLRYHPWIDEYVDALAVVTEAAPAVAQEALKPASEFARATERPPSDTPSTELPADRRSRRLERFVELGGEMRARGDTWHVNGGRRGALADLAREEQAARRPMADRADVRRDLIEAKSD